MTGQEYPIRPRGDHEFSEAVSPADFTPLDGPLSGEKFRLRPSHVVIGLTLTVFVAAAWFVLSAKSVFIDVTPVASEIDMSGGLAVKVGPRYLVHSGEVSLNITSEGYYPLDSTLTVSDEQNQTYHFQLLPLPGYVDFTTEPENGITVIIDGETVGTTPLSGIELAAGEHAIRLESVRYQTLSDTLTVQGRSIEESMAYTLVPDWAMISFQTEPAGAEVAVDGEVIGTTPLTAEVLSGERDIYLKLPAHKAWQDTLEVVALEDQVLPLITLEEAEGLVSVTSVPPDAGVTLNDVYQGQTPLEVELNPGEQYEISLFLNGYQTATRTLQVAPGEEGSLQIDMQPVTSDISINVSPANTEIWLNGERYGTGSQTIPMQALPQELEFRAEGYAPQTQSITPRPGLAQTLDVDLLTLEEFRIASIKPVITTPAGQRLRLLYPATFTMGASRREAGRQANEVLREVVLNRAFYIGETEVTNGQFRQFRPDHSSGVVTNLTLDNNNQPVVNLTWNDAALYCNWLSEQEGLPLFYIVEDDRVTGFNEDSTGYRLPTEAEWSWSARTLGENSQLLKYPWGNELPPPQNHGNYADLSAANILNRIINSYEDSFTLTAPVGSFPPNHHGLHDMGGNVAEWMHDFYGSGLGNSLDSENPMGPSTGDYHVVRGSSWAHASVTELRLSYRDYSNEARDDVGFRIARYLED